MARAYTVATTSNRLQSLSNPAATQTQDAAGNTLSDSSKSYTATYNLAGRMSSLLKGGVTTTYTYDAQGQRIRKFSSSGASSTVIFAYDMAGHLLGEYSNTGAALREYIWVGDTPVAMFTATAGSATPTVYYLHTDHLNTPRVAMSQSNQLRWRWLAEPFGTTAEENNPAGLGVFPQNLRFPGQYADSESGLYYNYFRDYDAATGRYVESDPIGLAGGINTYAYVGGNPLSEIDPTGLSPADVQKIFDTFNSTVNSMTAGGNRNPNPYRNNFSNSLNRVTGGLAGKPYLGCADQEAVTRDQLQKRVYEDT